MIPIYVEVDDRERLLRSIERERCQEMPKYKEVCRRFLADEEDFKEENLLRCGIDTRFKMMILSAAWMRLQNRLKRVYK